MKIIKMLNSYFLSDNEEEISTSDYAWFYGFYIFVFVIVIFTALSVSYK